MLKRSSKTIARCIANTKQLFC